MDSLSQPWFSTSKGRCRATSVTLAGMHLRLKDVDVRVVYPGSDDLLRVTRDSSGRLTGLSPDGEVFSLRAVKDVQVLQSLFEASNLPWPPQAFVARGDSRLPSPTAASEYGPRSFQTAVSDVLLDVEALSGNYPSSIPVATRKIIGHRFAALSSHSGVSSRLLRGPRARMAALWVEDDTLTLNQVFREVCETYPGLFILNQPKDSLGLLRRVWANEFESPEEFQDRSPLAHRLAEMISAASFRSGHRGRHAFLKNPSLNVTEWSSFAFTDFLGVCARLRTPPPENLTSPPMFSFRLKTPIPVVYTDEGCTVEGFESAIVSGSAWSVGVYDDEANQVANMASLQSSFCASLTPKVPGPEVKYCHTCKGSCRCLTGAAAVSQLTHAVGRFSDGAEHRWGAAHTVRPSRRFKNKAREMAPDVEHAAFVLLGEDAAKWPADFGSNVWLDLSLFMAQSGVEPTDLTAQVLEVFHNELSAAAVRATSIHSGWVARIQELQVMADSSPLTAAYLGRDGIYGFWAHEALVEAGVPIAPDVTPVYAAVSRTVPTESLLKLRSLSETGHDIVWVDTGFNGSVPARLDRVLYEHTAFAQDMQSDYNPPPEAVEDRRVFKFYEQKDPRMRLASSSTRSRAFTNKAGFDATTEMEHDAKGTYSTDKAAIGFDPGLPTSALEQLVFSQLQFQIKRQALQEARSPAAVDHAFVASVFYQEEALKKLLDSGLSHLEVACAGRMGLSVDQACKAHAEGVLSEAAPPPPSQRKLVSSLA